jgi:hypothetical protein
MRRMLAVLSSVFIVAFAGMAVSASPAFAGTGAQDCTGTVPIACLNAWNGGPWVDVYTQTGAVNNDFTIGQGSGPNFVTLRFTGTHNSWYGMCIGDAYNNQGDDRASLDPCPSGGNSGGWGVNFTVQNCTTVYGNGLAFKDYHLGGYLYPTSLSNGANWKLDGSFTCLNYYPPA